MLIWSTSTVKSDETVKMLRHGVNNIIQQKLKQSFPLLFYCTDESCSGLLSIIQTLLQIFSIGFKSEERDGQTKCWISLLSRQSWTAAVRWHVAQPSIKQNASSKALRKRQTWGIRTSLIYQKLSTVTPGITSRLSPWYHYRNPLGAFYRYLGSIIPTIPMSETWTCHLQ